ncbi:anti-sigma factor domain-containing protein [Cytobacillus sp. FSL W7-1323]|uniref:RsgI N-terminal anti-sigma domain-containing protein n=1 Tax=Cytobacillus kochii TaxID=859143 RepID=A0A248TD51_9BACI|nr:MULTISPECIES: anti-sigma factor domain-containing protein [Cytobacillus]ASV66158.1 hypothetical protein CKF48_01725 [Cytobacillus kochii]MEA1851736.1 anti-sigma factor domain-containing protein [Cytobacillus sp. OWB-43]
MKRGVIVAIDERFLTLLTNEGEFYFSYKYEAIYEIGQEIEFEPVMKNHKVESVKKPKYVKMIMIAAVFILSFLGLSLWPNHSEQTIYAYMTIDINPSIELAVNEQFEVIQLKGYNADGKKIIQEISDWKNKQFDTIFSDILLICKSQGYMQKGKELTFATVVMSDQYFKEERLRKHTDFVTRELNEEDVSLHLIEGSKTERELAQEKGLTLGAYMELNEKTEYDNTAKSDVNESEEEKKTASDKEESKEDNKESEIKKEKETSIEVKEEKGTVPTSDDNEAIDPNIETNESIPNNEVEEKKFRYKKHIDDEHNDSSAVTNKEIENKKFKGKHKNKNDDDDDDEKEQNDTDNSDVHDDDEWHNRHNQDKHNNEKRDKHNERKKYNKESP